MRETFSGFAGTVGTAVVIGCFIYVMGFLVPSGLLNILSGAWR